MKWMAKLWLLVVIFALIWAQNIANKKEALEVPQSEVIQYDQAQLPFVDSVIR